MARVAFIVTTCHEFEGIKVLSSVLKKHGHEADCFLHSEEKDFARAVQALVQDRARASRLGSAAQAALAARFGWPALAERTLELCRAAMGGDRR